MSNKFKNKYRTSTTRLQNWNYGWSAFYFITICTKDRKHFFGKIVKGKMHLSKIGELVKFEWEKTPSIRPDMNLELGEFMVMPDHFHAIISIGKNRYNKNYNKDRIAMHCDSIKNEFGPQRKNLASIIRGFKSSITINARRINHDFAWQPKFYEHIIRNDNSYVRIQQYIINNPIKWSDD